MRAWLRSRAKPRDSFYFLVGCVIAYHEVFMAKEAQPLLIFTALFLWGLIPAFWSDRAKPDTPPPPSPPGPPTKTTTREPAERPSGMQLCVAW
jgi:hypothetical protein